MGALNKGGNDSMNISSTRLTARHPFPLTASQQTQTRVDASKQDDSFSFSNSTQDLNSGSVVKALAGVALGAGIGIYSGLNAGPVAGLGGALVSSLPSAFAGGVTGALISEKMGQTDSSRIVGIGLWGALIGGSMGAVGGAMAASQMSGLGSAIGLGLLGATSGLLIAGGN